MAALAVVVRQFLQHVRAPRQPPQFHGFMSVVLRGFDVRHAFYGRDERDRQSVNVCQNVPSAKYWFSVAGASKIKFWCRVS